MSANQQRAPAVKPLKLFVSVHYFTHRISFCLFIRMPDPPASRLSASLPEEPKSRGANRSTKVAGKLKVLPEQPDHLPVLGNKPPVIGPPKDNADSAGTAGDSDDGDVEEDEQEEDVEVGWVRISTHTSVHARI